MASIQERIAALNMNHVNRPPPGSENSQAHQARANRSQGPPPLPERSYSVSGDTEPAFEPTVGNLPIYGAGPSTAPQRAEKKRLPLPPPRPGVNRNPSSQSTALSSSLSPRTPSMPIASKRSSQESLASNASSHSASGRERVLVPTYDPASLPVLPARKTDNQARPGLGASRSTSNIGQVPIAAHSQTPGLPPRQSTSRSDMPTLSHPNTWNGRAQSNGASTMPAPKRSALTWGLSGSTSAEPPPALPNRIQVTSPALPNRPNVTSPALPDRTQVSAPALPANKPAVPPVPVGSKPNLAAMKPSKPAFNGTASQSSANPSGPVYSSCLKCLDYSAPDYHASRFPRKAIPTTDVNWLAQQLADQFPEDIDKARVIFTWLHHNIAYDTVSFFGNDVKPSDPVRTIQSGLAVCEGYAGLFASLCLAAGMECIVIGGHGAGFGFKTPGQGEALPDFHSNHAWNAVKLNGRWKLVEPCWGAGYIGADRQYHQHFQPEWFTMDNDEFGRKHFPSNPSHFLRTDGASVTWEEYIIGPDGPGENVQVFTGVAGEHGISEYSITPRKKVMHIRSQPATKRIQFKFSAVCEHFDSEAAGLGQRYMYVLSVNGKDGRKKENIPFSTTSGRNWWLEVPVEKLGTPGQTVHLYAVTSIDGKNGRGVPLQEYKTAVGRKGMSFGGVACWTIH